VADTIEFEAETEEAAVARASEALGVEGTALDYTIVDEGSEGVFGLGSRPVKIRVRSGESGGTSADGSEGDEASGESAPAFRGPAPEKAAQAERVAQTILDHMKLPGTVRVRDEDAEIVVVIEEAEGSEGVGEALGGSRPPAIPALQFLLNKIVNRFPEDRKHVTVEVPSAPKKPRSKERAGASSGAGGSGEKEKPPTMPSLDELRAAFEGEADEGLVEVGYELAQRALGLQKTLTIHPMQPGDRRAVHQTVMRIPGVQTVSEGEGLYRRMHIVPDALAKSGSGKRRRRRRGPRKGGRSSA